MHARRSPGPRSSGLLRLLRLLRGEPASTVVGTQGSERFREVREVGWKPAH